MKGEKKEGRNFPKVKGLQRKATKNGHRWILSERDSAGKIKNITVKILDTDPLDVFYKKISDARAALKKRKSGITFERYADEFFKSRGLADNTIKNYKKSLKLFSLDNSKNRAAITKILSADVKRSTTAQKIRQINSFFSWLCRKIPGLDNPADGIEYKSDRSYRSRIATDDEIASIIDFAKASQNSECLLFVLLLINTGARCSSVLALNKNSLDRNGYLHLYNVKAKRQYAYAIPIKSKEIIDLWRAVSDDGGIWTNDARNYQLRLTKFMHSHFGKDAKGEYLSPHSLRHTFATKALQNGVPAEIVSKLLDHSSVSITLNIYAKYSQQQIDDAIDKIKY